MYNDKREAIECPFKLGDWASLDNAIRPSRVATVFDGTILNGLRISEPYVSTEDGWGGPTNQIVRVEAPKRVFMGTRLPLSGLQYFPGIYEVVRWMPSFPNPVIRVGKKQVMLSNKYFWEMPMEEPTDV